MNGTIQVIGFDADDTLWVNEPYFREAEEKFCKLLERYDDHDRIEQKLYQTETNNIRIYGYGIKSFTLSMIETALNVSNRKLSQDRFDDILALGKELLSKPVVLIDGVEKVLKKLNTQRYKLIVITKGDLLDQQRKLQQSGLEDYFHHIEIVSDKKEEDYQKLLTYQDIEPNEFLMIGNSLKSDIEPVLNIGGYAIHIPYHITWKHEMISHEPLDNQRYHKVETIEKTLELLQNGKEN